MTRTVPTHVHKGDLMRQEVKKEELSCREPEKDRSGLVPRSESPLETGRERWAKPRDSLAPVTDS